MVVVLALVATMVAGVVVARRPLPQVDGTLQLEGLSGKVEVLRDQQGIPQVYADTADDLFRAQGFVQAQDRFFEMDFRRHATAGRLSELLGESTVETDLYIRTMGWRRVAAREYELLAPSTRAYLNAYSDGVNAYLKGRSATELSVEYTVLGLTGLDYEPEEWTPVDSLAWLKAMAWDLRGNMDEEIARTRLSVDRTPEQVDELYPRYPYQRHDPIVDAAAAARRRGAAARPALGPAALKALDAVQRGVEAIPDLLGRGDGIGSNSWAVSGEHTVSGKPLLANDPHLNATIPGIWQQMGLHCTTVDEECPFDVSGFTFAGMPGVVIGHNRDIAWGMTNLDPDVTDLFLEKVTGKTYLYDGKQVPLAERDEVIRVAGGVLEADHRALHPARAAALRRVRGALQRRRQRRRGLGCAARENGYAVALAWTALTPRPTADAIFEFNAASSWTEFREAASKFAVPSQNLVYADTDGNIGYQAPGAIPIRKSNRSGDYPAAGWLPENDWTGRLVPFGQLPNVLNPPEGFLVTANQAVTGPGYRWYLSDSWDQGYRSQRIRNVLTRQIEDGARLDVSDMTRLQLDERNPMAPVLVPYLMRQLMTSEYYADGQRLLLDWDYNQPADSAAGAYFNVVWSNVLRLTFHDQLPEQLWPDGGQRWMAVVSNLLREPDNQWWDDATTEGVVEDRDIILGRGDAGRPRRAHPQGRAEPEALGVGPAAPPRPGAPVPRPERHRRRRGHLQPRPVRGGRRQLQRRRHELGRDPGVRRHRCAVDADGGRPRRPRPLALAEPDRCLRSRGLEALPGPDAAVGRGADPGVGVQPRRRAQGERGHARARADRLASTGLNRGGAHLPRWPPRSPTGRGRRAARCPGPPRS